MDCRVKPGNDGGERNTTGTRITRVTYRPAANPLSPRSAERARSGLASSERAAQAAFGGDGGAAVVHPDAFDRAEQADVLLGRGWCLSLKFS
jgi:hypothetical protein